MVDIKVKICGNTRINDVEYAYKNGADSLGFIIGFPTSPRNLGLEDAYTLMKDIPSDVEIVVVVPQNNLGLLRRISVKLPIDSLQLIGDNVKVLDIRRIFKDKHLIKVVHADPQGYEKIALEAAENYDAVLIDSKENNMFGGTGKLHNWNIAKNIVKILKPTRTILAGGLTPDNVGKAVKIVIPSQVDVASGVESSPGIKNYKKISEFIKNAKQGLNVIEKESY